MKIPQIEIKDNKKTWGIYDILQANWNPRTKKIESILVDWYRDGHGSMVMTDINEDNNFTNENGGNLIGKIINYEQ